MEVIIPYLEYPVTLPDVPWSEIGTARFWAKPQNVINLYLYLGVPSIPISFLVGFFGTPFDEKRVSNALETIFKISLLIIPIALVGIYILVNGYQAVLRGLNGPG